MANITISPNMSMPVPTVGEDPGPDWATNIAACLSVVDSHNHSAGQGVPITPDGLNINVDLPIDDNNIVDARSIRFSAQPAAIGDPADLGCVYVAGEDLYYNDESGNQIRITQGGSVAGSTGTITGLPSGTASASYSAGTFTFQGATSTPATMAVGPLVIGRAAASPKTVTLAPNSGQAANFDVTFPAALPGSTSLVTLDTSGNLSYATTTGSGSVVLATAPTFAGVPTGTVTGASFSPTLTWSYVSGATITITLNTSTWYYMRIGNVVSVNGKFTFTTSGFTSGASYSIRSTIPIVTASLTCAGGYQTFTQGAGQTPGALVDVSNTAVATATVSYATNSSFTGSFSYSYLVS